MAGSDERETLPGGADGDVPWTAATAAVIRSATKGVAAAVPHLLHQRGQLDLDAPVARYWPEFGAHGKERVLVRQLLSHRAGLPALTVPLSPALALDGRSGARALAAQEPVWEPGTAHGYHAHTYGWLLGELVRRTTGRTLGQWFEAEVARPLGLDLWIGLPVREHGRVARLERAERPEPPRSSGLRVRAKDSVVRAYRDPDSLTRRAFDAIVPAPDENSSAYRAAELPASGGIATARSLSRFYAALIGPLPAHGTPPPTDASRPRKPGAPTDAGPGAAPDTGPYADDPAARFPAAARLFTPATLAQARAEDASGPDRVLVVATRFGLGYMLHGPSSPMLGPGSFGHPGRGGSLAFADPESGTAFAYVTAGMQKSVTSDPRAQALVHALRACL
ncbi:serine hydrolase domain-containing protein [Streptomyces sp. AJS327]|uniref:serine hydrolase domain-containing protein n=1 Tax=Streptomyces sp. AJS327 TaxID=2545265 RepID=UPI0035B56CE3